MPAEFDPDVKHVTNSAAELMQLVKLGSVLFDPKVSPFDAQIAEGAPKLVVITGDNASGKSLFFRAGAAFATTYCDLLPITISIRERIGATDGMRRAVMFGDESDKSTGATSVGVVSRGMNNVERETRNILMLDEPELGLADSYATAMGEMIGQRALQVPDECVGVVVITHSRLLVQGLRQGYGSEPTHVAVAAEEPAVAGLDAWIERSAQYSVEDLMRLDTVGHERWLRINKLLPS